MCLAPVEIKGYHEHSGIGMYRNTLKSRYILVPCGKCAECVKDRQNAWFVRTYYQFLNTKGNIYFITLTYNNKSVSQTDYGYTLNRSDVQKWLKRGRRYGEYHKTQDGKISYFMCGEYGKKTFRPHYHLILFGVSAKTLDYMLTDWQTKYGFTNHKKVARSPKDMEKVARYVSKYSTKLFYNREHINAFCLDNELQKPFLCASIGYGALTLEQTGVLFNHVLQNSQSLQDCVDKCEFNIPIGGFKYKIPQYISKKLQYEKICSFSEWACEFLLFQPEGLTNFLPRSWKSYFALIKRLRFDNVYNQKLSDLSDESISRYSEEQRLSLQERIRAGLGFKTTFEAKQSLDTRD